MQPTTAYFCLFAAIVFEVSGTLLLPASQNFTNAKATIFLVVLYGVSFYFLSIVVNFIPIAIMYATWSGLGIFTDSVSMQSHSLSLNVDFSKTLISTDRNVYMDAGVGATILRSEDYFKFGTWSFWEKHSETNVSVNVILGYQPEGHRQWYYYSKVKKTFEGSSFNFGVKYQLH